MKAGTIFSVILGMSYCLGLAAAPAEKPSVANETRQIRFAERVITIELTRALSSFVREARAKCSSACTETGALELGVGLIGLGRSDIASEALVNLLGLRLDGAGSEEVSCQILARGKELSPKLKKLQPELVSGHCKTTFNDLRRRELADVPDVTVEQVCRADAEILNVKNDLAQAISSNVTCELE